MSSELRPRVCENTGCQREYQPRRRDQRFCSASCRPSWEPCTDRRARSRGRSGRPWERTKASVWARSNICGICGDPVDMSLEPPHPMSRTVDHKVALIDGGDELDERNLQTAHRRCNEQKERERRKAAEAKPAPLVTSRRWLTDEHPVEPAPAASDVATWTPTGRGVAIAAPLTRAEEPALPPSLSLRGTQ